MCAMVVSFVVLLSLFCSLASASLSLPSYAIGATSKKEKAGGFGSISSKKTEIARGSFGVAYAVNVESPPQGRELEFESAFPARPFARRYHPAVLKLEHWEPSRGSPTIEDEARVSEEICSVENCAVETPVVRIGGLAIIGNKGGGQVNPILEYLSMNSMGSHSSSATLLSLFETPDSDPNKIAWQRYKERTTFFLFQNTALSDLDGVLVVAQQYLLGMEHMVSRGYIHRDMKEGNTMLVAEEGTIKIIDHGLACPTKHEDSNRFDCLALLAGTPHYVAPSYLAYNTVRGGHYPETVRASLLYVNAPLDNTVVPGELLAGMDFYAIGVIVLGLLFGHNPIGTPCSQNKQLREGDCVTFISKVALLGHLAGEAQYRQQLSSKAVVSNVFTHPSLEEVRPRMLEYFHALASTARSRHQFAASSGVSVLERVSFVKPQKAQSTLIKIKGWNCKEEMADCIEGLLQKTGKEFTLPFLEFQGMEAPLPPALNPAQKAAFLDQLADLLIQLLGRTVIRKEERKSAAQLVASIDALRTTLYAVTTEERAREALGHHLTCVKECVDYLNQVATGQAQACPVPADDSAPCKFKENPYPAFSAGVNLETLLRAENSRISTASRESICRRRMCTPPLDRKVVLEDAYRIVSRGPPDASELLFESASTVEKSRLRVTFFTYKQNWSKRAKADTLQVHLSKVKVPGVDQGGQPDTQTSYALKLSWGTAGKVPRGVRFVAPCFDNDCATYPRLHKCPRAQALPKDQRGVSYPSLRDSCGPAPKKLTGTGNAPTPIDQCYCILLQKTADATVREVVRVKFHDEKDLKNLEALLIDGPSVGERVPIIR